MNYGVYKFGSFNKIKCDCGWEGVRADLRKALVVLEETKCGTIFDAEDVYVCPNCDSRKY
ncbi:hypothetical protein [Bacillus sp. FJAT-42315]|uniref:hypothetical protein n=1 Tax=Bacillus sp. FJAT-42315 TaxID=2014077 RepID=UPI000BA95ECF|nr:hypothetical protein [Bacillus sp. FJAT-42315]PAQ15001.1 hypothetical protein CD798_08115 [Bacillaceae bacterium SAOS 7]